MKKFLKFSFLATSLAVSTVLTFPSMAQATDDCSNRGDLDTRYCDADNDLIADIPTDPAQWIDPKTLIFAYTPVEDPAVYKEAWSDFLEYLQQKTGKKIVFFPVQSNAAQIEAMRSGRLHIAGFNTGSNPLAVNCAGFRPMAMMAKADGSFGYEMEIITYPGSGINKVEDIKGQKMAFTAPTSNSGFKAPSAILKADYNMIPKRDFEAVFSGKHDNSIIGVANKDYKAAAIANSVLARVVSRNVVKMSQLKSLYKSQTFPTTGFGVAYNLKPELQQQIRDAFENFPWEGSSLKEEFGRDGEAQFIPITYKKYWAVIRKIDSANNIKYTCS